MKVQKLIAFILPVILLIVGIGLNFNEFLMGSAASIKNLIVTLGYLVTWVFVLLISVKHKHNVAMKCYFAFWLITLIFAILILYINIADITAGWAIPFVILVLTPWYGIDFFVSSFVAASIIISVVSIIMISVTVLSLRKSK